MAEYRVTKLIYAFRSEQDHVRFTLAAPMTGEFEAFTWELRAGVFTALPTAEFRDREDARRAVEAELRAWEQTAFLSPQHYRIRFEYDRSDVEEINRVPGTTTVFVEAAVGHASAGNPTVITDNGVYPEPATGFERTPLTELLVERVRRALDREAELPAVAYYVLTAIEKEFGAAKNARRVAARRLSVSPIVLTTLGKLAVRNDPETGRKARGEAVPFTADETSWMMAVMLRLVRRIGETAKGIPLTEITMADFPDLS